jgi:NhaA family Na+:H+ antiporter
MTAPSSSSSAGSSPGSSPGSAVATPEPSSSLAPEAWEPLLRLSRLARRPLDQFLRIQAASGIVLFVAAAVAMAWANSSWSSSYHALWSTPVGLTVGGFSFERTLEWIVNDALMVVFFFVVGLEIKRELHHGELSDARRAALPAAAALGGMIAPAVVFLVITSGHDALQPGWGVPTATDIAFAVGVLALLGPRVPPALRVLLLALAVIDDLGAIVVIALFYSSGVAWGGLGVAAFGVALVWVLQKLGVRTKLIYVVPGVIVWAGIYRAGVHPTIAGVLMGLLTPVRAWLGGDGFVRGAHAALSSLSGRDAVDEATLVSTLRAVDLARREALSPAESLIGALSPWVAFGVMPLFALANAGVAVEASVVAGEGTLVAAGAALGLLIGKPLGIVGITLALQRLRLVALPAGLSTRHVVVLGVVAGIGFTMALFVAQLAFPVTADAAATAANGLLPAAKLGVLGGSVAAALAGLVLGRMLLPSTTSPSAAISADEAETSTEK